MAIYPKIQSPCPYKGDISAIMDGDVCRLCKREVFDLTHMSDLERVSFMKGCAGEVCVKYAFPMRVVAAAALAAAAIAVPTAAAACSDETEVEVWVGGINDPANLQYVQVPDATTAPALPVVYEPQGQGDKVPTTAKS